MPPQKFREVFKKAVIATGLPETFKPYSLRRGGASHYFRLTGDMARAVEIGRWRDVRTARIYINTALLAFAENTPLGISLAGMSVQEVSPRVGDFCALSTELFSPSLGEVWCSYMA